VRQKGKGRGKKKKEKEKGGIFYFGRSPGRSTGIRRPKKNAHSVRRSGKKKAEYSSIVGAALNDLARARARARARAPACYAI